MYDWDLINGIFEEILKDMGSDHVYRRSPVNSEGYAYGGSCYYVRREEGECCPDCIIGHLLYRLGELNLEAMYGSSRNSDGIQTLLSLGFFEGEFTYRAKWFMTVVQNRQDNGATWGNAVAFGRRVTEDVSEEMARDMVTYP